MLSQQKSRFSCFFLCQQKKLKRTILKQESQIVDVQVSPIRNENYDKQVEKELVVNTKFNSSQIQSSDNPNTKEEKKIYKYNCPVCFRYFNQILEAQCCKNYLCHFCCDEIQDKLRNNNKLVAICFFCQGDGLLLRDVDPQKPIRKYSDSVNSTLKSQINIGKVSKIHQQNENQNPNARIIQESQLKLRSDGFLKYKEQGLQISNLDINIHQNLSQSMHNSKYNHKKNLSDSINYSDKKSLKISKYDGAIIPENDDSINLRDESLDDSF